MVGFGNHLPGRPIIGENQTIQLLSNWSKIKNINYNDNELFCGGFQHQVSNDYECGICGDPWEMPRPRKNELGGFYGDTGLIPRNYNVNEYIDLTVQLTAHHKGWFEFKICSVDGLSTESEDCFGSQSSLMYDEKDNYRFLLDQDVSKDGKSELSGSVYKFNLRPPHDMKCDHCVIQWHYHTGNSWGCGGGKCGIGEGQQEEFYGCADVSITGIITESSTSLGTSSAVPTPAKSTTLTTSTTKTTSTEEVTEIQTTHAPTVSEATTEGDISNNNKLFCERSGDGIYRDPENCSQFIQCYDSIKYVTKCPGNLRFNNIHNYCDFPHNVHC